MEWGKCKGKHNGVKWSVENYAFHANTYVFTHENHTRHTYTAHHTLTLHLPRGMKSEKTNHVTPNKEKDGEVAVLLLCNMMI